MNKTASVYAHDTAPVQASKGTKLAWLPHTLILSVSQVSSPGQGSEKHAWHACLWEWLQKHQPCESSQCSWLTLQDGPHGLHHKAAVWGPGHSLATKATPLLGPSILVSTYTRELEVNQVLRLDGAGPARSLLDRSRLVRAVKAVRNVGSGPLSWLSEKSRLLPALERGEGW
jgi:hypothetical protein